VAATKRRRRAGSSNTPAATSSYAEDCRSTSLSSPIASLFKQHGAIGLSLHAVELPEGSDI